MTFTHDLSVLNTQRTGTTNVIIQIDQHAPDIDFNITLETETAASATVAKNILFKYTQEQKYKRKTEKECDFKCRLKRACGTIKCLDEVNTEPKSRVFTGNLVYEHQQHVHFIKTREYVKKGQPENVWQISFID